MIEKSIKGDIFGGATAAVVALPLALAFGVSSGAGALAGLYGAIFAGFFATIFGGTKVQVTGPTGPMTVVMALVVTHFGANLAAAFTVVLLAGVLQVLFSRFGIGRYIKLIPQPVVSGFMSGIGIIIIAVEIGPILGHEIPPGTVLEKLVAVPQMFGTANVQALLVAVGVLAVLILTPARLARFIPPPLIALLLGTIAVQGFAVDVPLIGTIPTGLPTITIPDIVLTDVPFIVRFALVLAFLGSIDSLLTSIVVDSMTRIPHDSNRELLGQGLGNIAAGIFGGLPSAGATMRTLVNVRAGGNSRLSGVFHSIILFTIVLGFTHAVSLIPLAVLAGILVKVGIDIIDWQYLKRIRHEPRAEVVIMLSTLLLTVLVDLMTAVATGFVMASVLFVAKMADSQVKNARFSFGADQIEDLSNEEQGILEEYEGQIVLFHVEGPLSFGSARDVARLMHSNIDKDVLAIDLRHVPFIDSSASAAIDEVIQRLNHDGDTVLLFGAREPVAETLAKSGVLGRLGEENLVIHRIDALRKARSIIEASKKHASN